MSLKRKTAVVLEALARRAGASTSPPTARQGAGAVLFFGGEELAAPLNVSAGALID